MFRFRTFNSTQHRSTQLEFKLDISSQLCLTPFKPSLWYICYHQNQEHHKKVNILTDEEKIHSYVRKTHLPPKTQAVSKLLQNRENRKKLCF